MIKTYIKVWYPGTLFSDSSVKEVDARVDRPEISDRAYAWQYFDRECLEKNGETLLGEPKNHSPTFYLGEELSAEQALIGASSTLRLNIECNGYSRLVRTRRGQIFPLGENEIVVKEPAE